MDRHFHRSGRLTSAGKAYRNKNINALKDRKEVVEDNLAEYLQDEEANNLVGESVKQPLKKYYENFPKFEGEHLFDEDTRSLGYQDALEKHNDKIVNLGVKSYERARDTKESMRNRRNALEEQGKMEEFMSQFQKTPTDKTTEFSNLRSKLNQAPLMLQDMESEEEQAKKKLQQKLQIK
jgi:hypothetical protein